MHQLLNLTSSSPSSSPSPSPCSSSCSSSSLSSCSRSSVMSFEKEWGRREPCLCVYCVLCILYSVLCTLQCLPCTVFSLLCQCVCQCYFSILQHKSFPEILFDRWNFCLLSIRIKVMRRARFLVKDCLSHSLPLIHVTVGLVWLFRLLSMVCPRKANHLEI